MRGAKVHQNCTIVRTFVRTHGTLNIVTGESRKGHSETVTEPCSVPLFSSDDKANGVCRSCREGWEVPENKFATDAERQRATTTPAVVS